jgi:hypothetical protein
MDEKKISLLVDHPFSFNYAVTCTAFDLNGDQPKLLVVDYQGNPEVPIQKRLPGGRFQVKDLTDAIDWFLSEFGRRPGLEFVGGEIENQKLRYSPMLLGARTNGEHNRIFNEFTAKLLDMFQSKKCQLPEKEIKILFQRTQINTIRHELMEETDASEIGDVYLSSAPQMYDHYKISFSSTEVVAPALYKWSADPKVLKSSWEIIDENTHDSLFLNHRTKFLEGVAQTVRFNLHPNAHLLSKFNLASM